MPLVADINPYEKSVYWKDQFGVVTVSARISPVSGSFSASSIKAIAIMPEGYRPKSVVTKPAALSTATETGNCYCGQVQLLNDGRMFVTIYSGQVGVNTISFHFSYIV